MSSLNAYYEVHLSYRALKALQDVMDLAKIASDMLPEFKADQESQESLEYWRDLLQHGFKHLADQQELIEWSRDIDR